MLDFSLIFLICEHRNAVEFGGSHFRVHHFPGYPRTTWQVCDEVWTMEDGSIAAERRSRK